LYFVVVVQGIPGSTSAHQPQQLKRPRRRLRPESGAAHLLLFNAYVVQRAPAFSAETRLPRRDPALDGHDQQCVTRGRVGSVSVSRHAVSTMQGR
jgi:hypothetical protein